jgi:hypothetical protein
VDALLVWDMESTYDELVRALVLTDSASIGGSWRLLER